LHLIIRLIDSVAKTIGYELIIALILPSSYLFFYHINTMFLTICGTEWPILRWCAVKKLLTHSWTHGCRIIFQNVACIL